MSAAMVKKLIAVGLATVLLVGSVGEAFAAKPNRHDNHKPKNQKSWQVSSFSNGTWD